MTWAKDLREGNVTTPSPQGTVWDYVIIGGDICPGVAHVTITSPDGLDKKKSKGKKKATITDNGDDPLEINIDLDLLPGDLEYFREKTLPTLRPRTKSGAREALAFRHPMADLWNIQNIIVGTIKTPAPTAGGIMRVNIQAYEWVPQPSVVKSTGKVQGESKSGLIRKVPFIIPSFGSGLPPFTAGDVLGDE